MQQLVRVENGSLTVPKCQMINKVYSFIIS